MWVQRCSLIDLVQPKQRGRADTVFRTVRLLIICPHFAPDVAPTGEVMTRIVEELAARDHEIHVVTALPWYLDHRVVDGWGGRLVRREPVSWGRISRVYPFPTADKQNLLRRALAFGGFTALACAVATAGGRVDGVLAMSPPLTLGSAGWIASFARRAPLVFNIQDVFPDVAVDVGAMSNPRVISALRKLERFSYARADAVTVLSEDLRENLTAKVADASKIRVIPNFADVGRIVPGDRMNSYRAELGIGDQTVVMYAGNVGYSQPLDIVVGAARQMADRPDVHFVINGSGSGRAQLESLARGLSNITFVDLQARERLGEVLAAGDVHLVLLKRGLAASSVPSKTYSIMAAGRALLASVDPGTEVSRLVESSQCGIAVPPEDPTAFLGALTELVDDAGMRASAGTAGRKAVEQWYSPAAVALAYEELFTELIAR